MIFGGVLSTGPPEGGICPAHPTMMTVRIRLTKRIIFAKARKVLLRYRTAQVFYRR